MKKDQELSMLIGKRMTNRDTMFNEYLYEVLNAAQESGQRMGYAQGRDETAREILKFIEDYGFRSIGDKKYGNHYKLTDYMITIIKCKYGIEEE